MARTDVDKMLGAHYVVAYEFHHAPITVRRAEPSSSTVTKAVASRKRWLKTGNMQALTTHCVELANSWPKLLERILDFERRTQKEEKARRRKTQKAIRDKA